MSRVAFVAGLWGQNIEEEMVLKECVFPRLRLKYEPVLRALCGTCMQRCLFSPRITPQSAKSVALIDYHLGLIALAVEEKSAAQESLEKSAVRHSAPQNLCVLQQPAPAKP